MALKDLVADRSKLTEAAIEEIIQNYVHYDPDAYEVVLTPAGLTLSNDAKILVFLVAIAGWQYVVDEVRTVDTKPAALEKMTGIPGGTLRPTLKRLKDSHLVASAGDGYTIRIANLNAIGRAIAGQGGVKSISPRKSKRAAAANSDNAERAQTSHDKQPIRARRKTAVPVSASLSQLVNSGFFESERTLGQVVVRLHEMAINAKTTSLSGPIAEMVRNGKLVRKKTAEGGKNVWSYKRT